MLLGAILIKYMCKNSARHLCTPGAREQEAATRAATLLLRGGREENAGFSIANGDQLDYIATHWTTSIQPESPLPGASGSTFIAREESLAGVAARPCAFLWLAITAWALLRLKRPV